MVNKIFKKFDKQVDELVKLGKPKIAFGLKEIDEEILKSLEKSKKYAKITIVGTSAVGSIKDFNLITDNKPEERIISLLVNNEVDGIIRGTLDDFKTYEIYEKMTGEKYTIVPGLLEDSLGRQFFISSASNPEGWEKEEKLKITEEIAEFVKGWGVKPKIAVLAGERHETYPRKKHVREGVVGILNQTYEDAEWVVENLKNKGYDAENLAIDSNIAIENDYNILVPVNGMVGNQMFRILLSCGGKILSATRLGLSHFYEDNSRSEKDFTFHIKWITALINKKKHE